MMKIFAAFLILLMFPTSLPAKTKYCIAVITKLTGKVSINKKEVKKIQCLFENDVIAVNSPGGSATFRYLFADFDEDRQDVVTAANSPVIISSGASSGGIWLRAIGNLFSRDRGTGFTHMTVRSADGKDVKTTLPPWVSVMPYNGETLFGLFGDDFQFQWQVTSDGPVDTQYRVTLTFSDNGTKTMVVSDNKFIVNLSDVPAGRLQWAVQGKESGVRFESSCYLKSETEKQYMKAEINEIESDGGVICRALATVNFLLAQEYYTEATMLLTTLMTTHPHQGIFNVLRNRLSP